jgi:predicted Zn-dependent peptidase
VVVAVKVININNIRVLHIRMQSGIVNIRVDVSVGACSESPEQYGIAHFLEHVMFKGTAKRTAKDIKKAAARIGGKLNAWTAFDQTMFHITALKEEFDSAFELLSDLFLNTIFPEKEIEKERVVILDEIRRSEDRPASWLHHKMSGRFWSHNIDHRILGLTENIKRITRHELISWRNRYYSGENIQIAVAGDVTSQQVTDAVSRYFFSSHDTAKVTYPEVMFRGGEDNFYKSGITATYLFMAYPALPRNHTEHVRQRVMAYVLGGHASSLLFERIREEMGLVYGIGATVLNAEAFNTLSIGTSSKPDDTRLIEKVIKEIIDELCSSKISKDRLVMAKASMLSSIRMLTEAPVGMNQIVAPGYLKGDSENMYKRLNEEIPKVTRDDVLSIAQATFRTQPYIGRLWPQ